MGVGDGAKRDEEGYIWLLGRVDDMMNVSGHRISTLEVEAALVDHPAVAEAAVVGRADNRTGQAIAAFVTLKSTVKGDEELIQELRNQVATEIGNREDRAPEEHLDRPGHAQDPLQQDHAEGHRVDLQLRRRGGHHDAGARRSSTPSPTR